MVFSHKNPANKPFCRENFNIRAPGMKFWSILAQFTLGKYRENIAIYCIKWNIVKISCVSKKTISLMGDWDIFTQGPPNGHGLAKVRWVHLGSNTNFLCRATGFLPSPPSHHRVHGRGRMREGGSSRFPATASPPFPHHHNTSLRLPSPTLATLLIINNNNNTMSWSQQTLTYTKRFLSGWGDLKTPPSNMLQPQLNSVFFRVYFKASPALDHKLKWDLFRLETTPCATESA